MGEIHSMKILKALRSILQLWTESIKNAWDRAWYYVPISTD